MFSFLSKLGALRKGSCLQLAQILQGTWWLPKSSFFVPDMQVQQPERDAVVNSRRSVSVELPNTYHPELLPLESSKQTNIHDKFPTEEALHLHASGL